MTLYRDIANKIKDHIESGVYRPGSRLLGVRRLAVQFGVSVSTIVQAQRQLENVGLLEARPRSGYFVLQSAWQQPKLPAASRPVIKPTPVTGQELLLQLARLNARDDFVQLGPERYRMIR